MVSLRTVQTCLGRLTAAGLIAAIGGSRGVSPVYVVTEEGKKIVEAYK
jgi:predicted transcriptional regulator